MPEQLSQYLPWSAMIRPDVVACKHGGLLAVLRFVPPDLDTEDDLQLMASRARLGDVLSRLDGRWAAWLSCRREALTDYLPEADWPCEAAALVDQERREAFEAAGAQFRDHHHLALILVPAHRVQRLASYVAEGRTVDQEAEAQLRRFLDQLGQIEQMLGQIMQRVERLAGGALMAHLHDTCSANPGQPVLPVPIHLDMVLADSSLEPGRSAMLGRKHLRVLSIRHMPAETQPRMLEALRSLPFAYRWTVRWLAMDRDEARSMINRTRKRWNVLAMNFGKFLGAAFSGQDPGVSVATGTMRDDLDEAEAEMTLTGLSYGYVTMTVSVMGDQAHEAQDRADAVAGVLAAAGFVPLMEDHGTADAWLGAVPGNIGADIRRMPVHSLSLADMTPASGISEGSPVDSHLGGPALLVAQTESRVPAYFSLHAPGQDVGHTAIVGPTGSGKSALMSLLALQFMRYPRAQAILIDRGRSSRCMCLCADGAWLDLAAGDLALQPLRAVDQPAERAWATDWLVKAMRLRGVPSSPTIESEIDAALCLLAREEPDHRTLSVLAGLLGQPDHRAVVASLSASGPHGALLDGQETDRMTDRPIVAIEVGDLLDRDVGGLVLLALFQRLRRARIDGRPTLLIVDEAWRALQHEVFGGWLQSSLREMRKWNCSVVLATQSIDDLTAGPLLGAMTQIQNTVWLPNGRALEPNIARLYQGAGLGDRMVELIARSRPKCDMILQTPTMTRPISLPFGPLQKAICGSSSPSDHEAMDRLLAERRPFLSAWIDRCTSTRSRIAATSARSSRPRSGSTQPALSAG